MNLTKIVKNFFRGAVWVFAILIVSYFILNFLASRGIPILSTGATWVEQHAQPGM